MKIGVLLFWLLVWEGIALLIQNKFLLVTPVSALLTLFHMVQTMSFWESMIASLMRIGFGFILGVFAGILLSALGYRFAFFEMLLRPLIACMKTVPVVSFVVLLLIWWGPEQLALAICFLIVFPNTYISMLEGLQATPKDLLEVKRVYDITVQNSLLYIYRPCLEPFLKGSLKLSLGLCWKSGVAAEVIGMATHSIGGSLYRAKISLDTGEIIAWTAVVVLISVCFEKMVLGLVNRFFAWKPKMGVKAYQEMPSDLRIEKVCKAYGENPVLQDYTAQIQSGELLELDWPSGAGKTTLFRLLLGLEAFDRGSVKLPKKGVLLFQEDRLLEGLSAVENVTLVTGNEDASKEALLELLPENCLEQNVNELSGGMKRRVALARAMMAKADFVLLDEPFTGLDTESRLAAKTFIEKHMRGRAIVLATHIEV